MRWSIVLFLLLTACGTPCPSDPLRPVTSPGWVVRFNEPPNAPPPSRAPGTEAFSDPSGLGTYAAFALYDDAGAIDNERWLDSATTLERVIGSVDAAAILPSRQSPGSLTLLLADGLRPALSFDLTTGDRSFELSTYVSAPEAAGQLVDLADLGNGIALVARRRSAGGLGGDLLLVDLAGDRGVLELHGLSGLSSGRVEPGNIAALTDAAGTATRVVVGLGLLDEDEAGAVALLDLVSGELTRLDLFGLVGCERVAALGGGRVAVLCTGDLEALVSERIGAGFALLEAPPGGPLGLLVTRPATSLFTSRPPTHGLVALAGDWVAAVSRGDPRNARPDALMVIDLNSDAGQLLHEEPWTEAFGAALGRGDFRDELWWPSASGVIYRWSMTGTDASASFVLLDPGAVPGCSRLSPREIRAIPSLPTPAPGG